MSNWQWGEYSEIVSSGPKTGLKKLKVKTILVTQPKPESDKSPYHDLAKKFNLKIDFREFIHVEGIPAGEFRKDKINLAEFNCRLARTF